MAVSPDDHIVENFDFKELSNPDEVRGSFTVRLARRRFAARMAMYNENRGEELSECGKIPPLLGTSPTSILEHMPRNLCHWTYDEVTEFLTAKGFEFFDHVESRGEAWMNFQENGEPNRIVEIKHPHGFYKPKQLKRLIRQSGIPEEGWLNWTRAG